MSEGMRSNLALAISFAALISTTALGVLSLCGTFESLAPAEVVFQGYDPAPGGGFTVNLRNVGDEATELVRVAGRDETFYMIDPAETTIAGHQSVGVTLRCPMSSCPFPFVPPVTTLSDQGFVTGVIPESIEKLSFRFAHGQAIEFDFEFEASVAARVGSCDPTFAGGCNAPPTPAATA